MTARLGWGAFVALALLVAPSLASAEIPYQDRCQDAAAAHQAAQRQLRQAQDRSDELAHRISVLKRRRQADGASPGEDRVLETLLRDSLKAERELGQKNSLVRQRAKGLSDCVRQVVTEIDRNMNRKRPGLRRGSRRSRAAIAAELDNLRKARNALKAQLPRASSPAPKTSDRWAELNVRIDPLDGPDELREKADFVEDARDKFEKKRKQLIALLAEAQRDREIERVDRHFRTSSSLFDETVRGGARVQRRGADSTLSVNNSGGGGTANKGRSADDEAAPTLSGQADTRTTQDPNEPAAFGGAAPAGEADVDGAQTPSDPSAGVESSPPPAPPASGSGDQTGVPTGASSQTPTPTGSSIGAMPRELNASNIIGLDLARLDTRKIDMAQLRAALAELQKLDGELAKRSKALKARAAKLERDEAKSLKVK